MLAVTELTLGKSELAIGASLSGNDVMLLEQDGGQSDISVRSVVFWGTRLIVKHD